jgi:hypothetical protein
MRSLRPLRINNPIAKRNLALQSSNGLHYLEVAVVCIDISIDQKYQMYWKLQIINQMIFSESAPGYILIEHYQLIIPLSTPICLINSKMK